AILSVEQQEAGQCENHSPCPCFAVSGPEHAPSVLTSLYFMISYLNSNLGSRASERRPHFRERSGLECWFGRRTTSHINHINTKLPNDAAAPPHSHESTTSSESEATALFWMAYTATMPPSRKGSRSSSRSWSSRTNPPVNMREDTLGGQKQNKIDQKWSARFEELLDYSSEHGDCNVPKSQGKLGQWVSTQRQVFMAGSMAQDRIDRLSSIGFKWTRKPTVLWEARFDELVQYKAKHGDCNVPRDQGQLGTWVNNQRSAYNANSLAQDRIVRLNNIGFKWATKVEAPTVPWETRFDELVRYKAKHGDCNVPRRQGQLGTWVSHQRTAYMAGSLGQDRIVRLNNIGFKWAPKVEAPTVPWETRFDELVQYKAKHDNCKVPQRQGPLGCWVNHQRRNYKKGKLAQDRVNRLNGIGFDWTLLKGAPRKRKDLPRTQNRSSSRKKRASSRSTNVDSASVGAGARDNETMNEGRDVTSVSLPAPSNRSYLNRGTESDDEVDEIGAFIYAQVMQRRQVIDSEVRKREKSESPSSPSSNPRSEASMCPSLKALPELCVSNSTAGYDVKTDSKIDMKFVKTEDAPIKTE
ncbi:hypothetical protein THAOC_17581, partial [Thalassiosira oceanica]